MADVVHEVVREVETVITVATEDWGIIRPVSGEESLRERLKASGLLLWHIDAGDVRVEGDTVPEAVVLIPEVTS